jgi:hypothetical protein
MLEYLVLTLISLNCLLTLWAMRVIAFEIRDSAKSLDLTLAAAIQKLIEGGIGEIEPINPIQQAIGQLIQQRMTGQQPFQELTRTDDGKFAPKE